jgi:hypothetical protein
MPPGEKRFELGLHIFSRKQGRFLRAFQEERSVALQTKIMMDTMCTPLTFIKV